jgi:hypothetical protein
VKTTTKLLVEKLAIAAADVPRVRNAGEPAAVAPPVEPTAPATDDA